eukprot:Selendium_serpulae@DN6154_c2_g1_i8.p1
MRESNQRMRARNQRITQLSVALGLLCSTVLFFSYRSFSPQEKSPTRRQMETANLGTGDRSAVFNSIDSRKGQIKTAPLQTSPTVDISEHRPTNRGVRVPGDRSLAFDRSAVFDRIYRTRSWHTNDTYSGAGSQKTITKTARECVGRWIKEYQIKSFGDICGDANWQTLIPNIHDITYVGYDVSPIALRHAARKNMGNSFTFKEIDICETVPDTKHDAFMIRDVLQHLPGDAGVRALKHIRESGAKYLIVSYYPGEDHNKDIRDGDMYRNNIYKPPFDVLGLPQPLDSCYNYEEPYRSMESYIAIIQINSLKGSAPIGSAPIGSAPIGSAEPKRRPLLTSPDKSELGESLEKILNSKNESVCVKQWNTKDGADMRDPNVRVCLDHLQKGNCTVISIGIGYEFIIDDVFLSLGCRVWSFDPSMKPGDYKRHPNHEFFHIGIGAHDGIHKGKSTLYKGKEYNDSAGYTEKTIETMVKEMGVDYVDVVRMDTEGSEWNVLSHWDFSKIGQLLIEIHAWDSDVKKMVEGLEAIPKSWLVFATCPNPWASRLRYKNLVDVYELSFINPQHFRGDA